MAVKTIQEIQKSKELVWRAAAYIRLSQEDRDNGHNGKTISDSVVNQKQIIDEFIKNQPDLGEYLTFVDDGSTGTNFERVGFQAMFEYIKNGNINCVIVKDLSRFGRNYTEAGTYMEQIFPMLGVRFIAINDFIDSHLRPNDMNSILIPLKNVLNEWYLRDCSRKQIASYQTRGNAGKPTSSNAIHGYIKNPTDNHNRPIDEATEIVKKISGLTIGGK